MNLLYEGLVNSTMGSYIVLPIHLFYGIVRKRFKSIALRGRGMLNDCSDTTLGRVQLNSVISKVHVQHKNLVGGGGAFLLALQ